ncbi:MAG: hypothetical protein JW904_14680 [Spirochaetales bacterium]|nr:hypothetical protein [Spirochaetales bacterium]
MRKAVYILFLILVCSTPPLFADTVTEGAPREQPKELNILPLGWGAEIFMYYPYTAFTAGDFGSSSFGLAASYNALVESFWISVTLYGMIGSVFNMDIDVEAHYLFGDPGWFAAPHVLAGVGFGIGGPFTEGNPVYIQFLIGGGILLLRNYTFQVHLSMSYSFPLVEETRFNSLSGLRFGIGIIYYIDVE